METEAKETILKSAPHLLKVEQPQHKEENEDGLGPINEDEELVEEGEEELNEEAEEEEGLRERTSEDRIDEEHFMNEEDDDEDSYNPNRHPRDSVQDNDNNDEGQDQNQDSNSEVEDAKILPQRPVKKEISAEDEEFMRQFDSIVTENIAVSIFFSFSL